MSESWIVEFIQAALGIWDGKLAEIWSLITQSPQEFKEGVIWRVIEDIHGSLQAIGYALLVLFFVVGVMKTCGSFTEIKRPEHALKLFFRFVIAKAVVTYGMELMLKLLEIIQGIISTIMNTTGIDGTTSTVMPEVIIQAILEAGFFESIPLMAVVMIGCIIVWILAFIMVLHVYGRFFKLYMYTAISPIPLASFAGEPSQNIGKSFLKSYAAVCLEGVIIVLACIVFSIFAESPPVTDPDASVMTMIWSYLGETIFNMLILVGSVKMADRIVKEIMGL